MNDSAAELMILSSLGRDHWIVRSRTINLLASNVYGECGNVHIRSSRPSRPRELVPRPLLVMVLGIG